MSVWRQLADADVAGPTAVTVGNFDGVHRGHRVVLDRTIRAARALDAHPGGPAPVVAVTFDPHPLSVLRPDRAPALLTGVDQRVELLRAAGADHVLVLAFGRELAGWSPHEFAARVLADALRAGVVVVGTGFRFGARAAGTVDTLRTEGAALGFDVDAVELAAGDVAWSSTTVREAVARGDLRVAAAVLGRDHTVEGTVVEGDHRGRGLGYPTANVPAPETAAVPADGVYAGTLRRLDRPDPPDLPAAVSVGTNPTFDGVSRRVEAYVLDRDDLALYGVPVRIAFHAHLRGQVRFDGVDDLVRQMAIDVERTRTALSLHPGQDRAAPR